MKQSPETILRQALVVARNELLRVDREGWVVTPDVFPQVNSALADVPAIPAIENASDDTERKIVGKLVSCLFGAGYSITVNDGEDDVLVGMLPGSEARIWEALASTDADILKVKRSTATHMHGAFIYLIWGNGPDVISDYSTSLEYVIKPANDLADELDGGS